MKEFTILRVVGMFLIPVILLFALYVQFHGDFGPGGGFQAGVIFAAGFILFTLIHGLERTRKVIPLWATDSLLALGVLLFAGTGMACIFKGGRFLEYGVLAHDPVHGQHLGIFLVELGVGLSVFAVMVTVFNIFASRGRR